MPRVASGSLWVSKKKTGSLLQVLPVPAALLIGAGPNTTLWNVRARRERKLVRKNNTPSTASAKCTDHHRSPTVVKPQPSSPEGRVK